VSRSKPVPPALRPVVAADAETAEQRAARVDALRDAYVTGSLDLTVRPDSDGVDRLLEDLFCERTERRRRSRR
jgi:hypothetical protein